MTTFIYPNQTIDTTGLATEAEQETQTALLTQIENNTADTEVNTGEVSSNTFAAISRLDSILAEEVAQTPLLTQIENNTADTEANTNDISSNTFAILQKQEAVLVTEPHDYRSITYVGATTDISTVVYKSGGAGGATVATLTMGYDGSNRLTSITKS